MFDHEIFQKCPALAALRNIEEPKPEHLRSCVLELSRLVMHQKKEIETLCERGMTLVQVPQMHLSEDERNTLRTLINTQENPADSVIRYVEHLLLVAYTKGKEDEK